MSAAEMQDDADTRELEIIIDDDDQDEYPDALYFDAADADPLNSEGRERIAGADALVIEPIYADDPDHSFLANPRTAKTIRFLQKLPKDEAPASIRVAQCGDLDRCISAADWLAKHPDSDDPPAAATEDEIDLSHDALALDLGLKGWDRDAKHVATWGKWLFWDGSNWRVDDRLTHMTKVRDYLRLRAAGLISWAEGKAAKAADKA